MSGQTLNGVSVNGFCIIEISYCSVTGTPFAQTAPNGYVSAPSNPGGCDFNGCNIGGVAQACQQNFCKDAQGSCGNCP